MESKNAIRGELTDPFLYKVYWKLILEDVCKHIELPPTTYVKNRLHEIHKKALNYSTIAGKPSSVLSQFIFEVVAEYAISGIFIRTSKKQPFGIEKMLFTDIVAVDGKIKQVWDLL
ncbi:MAG: hypothetical protein WC998_06740 [Candidatus Paceibacterota bacterium]|jgi:hypothetical protein